MNRPLWTCQEIIAATGGSCTGDFSVTGIAIDSREVAPGDLFIALQGDRFDGHDFVAEALSAGAAAAMVSRSGIEGVADKQLVKVDETFIALQALAKAARSRSNARIVAVTGSVGKTGTKEALRKVFEDQGPTHASVRSFNNEIGVPVSLARMPATARYAVFELGMNHPGELGPLSRQVRPHIALITTIENTHSAHFSSTDDIARAKAEIFEGLTDQGHAVLNRDNRFFGLLADEAGKKGKRHILSFGFDEEADAHPVKYCLKPTTSSVMAEIAGVSIAYKIGIPGDHWILNSLAVLACVHAAGADLSIAGLSLGQLTPLPGRGEVHEIRVPAGSFVLIDESYNASPAAMRAAIANLARFEPEGEGRRIAVIGDMLELGDDSAAQHIDLADPLADAGVARIFTYGDASKSLFAALPNMLRGGHAGDEEELRTMVSSALRAGDVVMIKGSNAMGLGALVEYLKTLKTEARPRAVNG